MSDTAEPQAGTEIFDAHFHLIDPRFPLVANQGYVPEPFALADYQECTRTFDLVGGAVVAASFQGFDQSHLLDALRRLGDRFVGVTQLPATASDGEIRYLDAGGVRAVRFNLYRNPDHDLDDLVRLGQRVAVLVGWHTEVYLDARHLPRLAPALLRLPKLCIDHLGLSRDGLPALLELAEQGVRVKATGFGRGDLDVPAALKAISMLNPDALMFGTDLPSTRAKRPFHPSDVTVVLDALGPELGRKALVDNALRFYFK